MRPIGLLVIVKKIKLYIIVAGDLGFPSKFSNPTPSPYLRGGVALNFSIISTLAALISESISRTYAKFWIIREKICKRKAY